MNNPYKYTFIEDDPRSARARNSRLPEILATVFILFGVGSLLLGLVYVIGVTAQNRHAEGVVLYFGLGGFSLLAARYYLFERYREGIVATIVAFSIPVIVLN